MDDRDPLRRLRIKFSCSAGRSERTCDPLLASEPQLVSLLEFGSIDLLRTQVATTSATISSKRAIRRVLLASIPVTQ